MQAETSVAEAVIGDDTVRPPIATAPIPGLVWAFRIHSDGSPESLAVDQPIEFTHDGLLWLHFNLADARALQWLASADLQAPVQARSLLLSKDTYQQLHITDGSVYGVISDLLRDIAEVTEETGYLRFVMTERLLVSGRHHALCAVDATRRALEDGHRIESVAALLEAIVENVADTMDRIADRIARSLDEIEEQVLSDDAVDLRERSRLLQEELHWKIEQQGNNSLRVLSVLTAILMPPTLVTGIFAMNTKGLPFTDLDTAFLWASLLMLLSSLAAYLIMKRIGIIR